MKVVRKILYVIAGLLVLLTILIMVCAYNPVVMEKIQGFIFRGRAVEVKEMPAGEEVPKEEAATEEEKPEEPQRMRTLEEAGISEESVIKDIESYYADCKDQIIRRGVGQYSFENVVSSEALVEDIYSKYSNKEYVSAYMDDALNSIGAYSYDMNLLVEELEGKNYRLTHQVTIN